MGARAFRPLESSFHELSHLGLPEFIKIAFDVCKDNYLFEIIFTMVHFLFRSCLRTRGSGWDKGVPPFAFLVS
jgi:hypothetical protein